MLFITLAAALVGGLIGTFFHFPILIAATVISFYYLVGKTSRSSGLYLGLDKFLGLVSWIGFVFGMWFVWIVTAGYKGEGMPWGSIKDFLYTYLLRS